MLIFVQVCRTIDKFFSVFNSSIGSEEQMKSNGCYKKEACVTRKHLKKRGSEDLKLTSSEALSSKADHQKLTSSEVLKIIRS